MLRPDTPDSYLRTIQLLRSLLVMIQRFIVILHQPDRGRLCYLVFVIYYHSAISIPL